MKPTEFKFPYATSDRYVLFSDRMLYVPERGDPSLDFAFPGWSSPILFGNDRKIHVEYCSGNGSWIAAKAEAHPEINWIAVEKKFVRARKIWSKIKNLNLSNLLVVCGEAHHVTKHYFNNDSIHAAFINFPDPWPKNRHAKHRLVQPEFARELWRILTSDSTLTFVTDDIPYSTWLIEVIGDHGGFTSIYPEPFYVQEQVEYGTSYFRELWLAKGRAIRYHEFKKVFAV